MNSMLKHRVGKIVCLLGLCLADSSAFAAKPPALPTKYTTRNIEGWSVRVDDRLFAGENADTGAEH